MSNAEKANILVVDDLPEKILVLRSVLEELGQNVVAARSGEEALRLVLENDFAVILLDVNMPGMDGFETAALIRRRKKSAHTPIIFITAFSDELHTARGYSLGAVDYILSPIVPEVLRTKVWVFVELFLMTQQVRRQADERVHLAREQAARAAAEEATRRSAFLAEASRALANSLDPETTVRGLARLVVPFLADLGAVVGLDERGQPGPIELAWRGGALQTETAAELGRLGVRLEQAVRRVMASRRMETLQDGPQPPTPATPGERGGKGPALILPLLARSRMLGVLVLARAEGAAYGQGDLALADDLAGRAAIALDNARLHQNIQEGDRRKDEFLAMLAHELRNPLAPIRNAVELMRRLGPHQPVLEQARDMIDRQVTHMGKIIDELLDVSRLSRGKILLRYELVELGWLVKTTTDDYRGPLEGQGLRLHVNLGEAPTFVRGDPTRLAQVVGNVLHNAGKFTESGGAVDVKLAAAAGRAVLSIRDSGIGIEPAMLPLVFEAFSQADRSLDRSRGGLGLGLTLVKRLIELHGGEVGVRSDGLGKGTEVCIALPTVRPPHGETSGPAAAHPQTGALRMLIIEDNVDAAESMRVLLTLVGHQVAVAFTGDAGLGKAREFLPDVVLCDIGLPDGMDGYAVARALRQDPALASAYLIAATGYGQAEDQRLAREAGFDAHLTKPVDFPALQELLAKRPRLLLAPATN
jgi:signal transduction histidine kinase/DNA-binding response OmpR family regulator